MIASVSIYRVQQGDQHLLESWMGLTLCISPIGLIFHRRHGEDGRRRGA